MVYIGLIGSGFIAKGFYRFIQARNDIKITRVLTRSDIKTRTDWPEGVLTNNIDVVLGHSELIVECTGDTSYASECLAYILRHDPKIVLTMNSELHITTGKYFYGKMPVFEAQGDQSGCMCAFDQEVREMGFRPLVYGNYKRYLNTNVGLEQALLWSKKNNISVDKTIAFTDGTKVEIENVLIANSLDAYFDDEIRNGGKLEQLIAKSKYTGKKFVDYFLDIDAPSGIFIATDHQKDQDEYLKYLKFDTKYQVLVRPFHFCHLEIYKSILDLMSGAYPRRQNAMQSTINRYMVASLTKRPIKAGERIEMGLGSLDFRGIHHNYDRKLVPITLLRDMVVKKDLPCDHVLSFSDVEYKGTLAVNIWNNNVE